MIILFVKMQAQGNDFVIIDNREQNMPIINTERARALAERRYGIGCDQILVLQSATDADARIIIFNSDGTQAENCGNGLRCVGWWLAQQHKQKNINIALQDRIVHIICDDSCVSVHMGFAKIISSTASHTDVCLGNPHRVMFSVQNEKVNPNINTEIISGQIGNDVYIDIIERGAGHTPACGSGACAVAAAVWQRQPENQHNILNIHMLGGVVQVKRDNNDKNELMHELILSGSVNMVFTGQFICLGKTWEHEKT
ncbi:MAG: diaminopimelate epimerase [Mariprofundales bacterium]